MSEPSTTPRTDAAVTAIKLACESEGVIYRSDALRGGPPSMTEFARILERELAYAISKDHEAIAADRVVERAIGRQEGAEEANPNADWMTEAHTLCTDWGIGHGRLTERIKTLRLKLEREKVCISEEPDMRWVPVSERLPVPFREGGPMYVLAVINAPGITKKEPYVDKVTASYVHADVADSKRFGEASIFTHWMPLPEAPK